jgi:hypothetical protein
MFKMKSIMSLYRLFAFVYLLISVTVGVNLKRNFSIVNDAGVKIEVFWVEPKTREAIIMTASNIGISDGGKMPFDSYVGHEFEIREMPAAETGECGNENNVCHSTTFIVPEKENRCESFVRRYV